MSANNTTGVYPLVCISCHHIVGVINVAAVEQMAHDGESYICRTCMEADPAGIEAALATVPDGEWPALTRQLADDEQARVCTPAVQLLLCPM